MFISFEFPLKQWPFGTHIDCKKDIKLKKKDTCSFYLGIDVFKNL